MSQYRSYASCSCPDVGYHTSLCLGTVGQQRPPGRSQWELDAELRRAQAEHARAPAPYRGEYYGSAEWHMVNR